MSARALRTELAIQKAITADFRVENQALRDKLAALATTCDATAVADLGLDGGPTAFGPCVLRAEHEGPGHKGANGAEWWPTPDPAPLRKLAEQTFAEGGLLPGVGPWSEVKADSDCVLDALATHSPLTAEGLYEQVMAMFGGPLPTQLPTPCSRCKSRGKVPDWTNWNHPYGEPHPKPCPDCAPKEPS